MHPPSTVPPSLPRSPTFLLSHLVNAFAVREESREKRLAGTRGREWHCEALASVHAPGKNLMSVKWEMARKNCMCAWAGDVHLTGCLSGAPSHHHAF